MFSIYGSYYVLLPAKKKMQIKVKCQCGASECREWALLETQGVLEIQPSAQHLPLHSLSIGSLCRSQQDKYYLTIGYHELEGKKVSLKKPMLVLQKLVKEEPMEIEPSPAIRATQYPKQVQRSVDLKVIGVIRHKILFKTRPKALISKVEVKAKKP
ncbi:hypothetical protein GOP47_0029528 [Adiantum capillus-veneris]|nr:hypothetical protein GOP47_0029528 [Adiantum capillus-veneris]